MVTGQKEVKRKRPKNTVENGIVKIVHTQKEASGIQSVTPISESHAHLDGDQTIKRQEKEGLRADLPKNLTELDHFQEISSK